jgi:LPXTG-motif cell wall-anchored protein
MKRARTYIILALITALLLTASGAFAHAEPDTGAVSAFAKTSQSDIAVDGSLIPVSEETPVGAKPPGNLPKPPDDDPPAPSGDPSNPSDAPEGPSGDSPGASDNSSGKGDSAATAKGVKSSPVASASAPTGTVPRQAAPGIVPGVTGAPSDITEPIANADAGQPNAVSEVANEREPLAADDEAAIPETPAPAGWIIAVAAAALLTGIWLFFAKRRKKEPSTEDPPSSTAT